MKKHKVIANKASFSAGQILELSPEQYASRQHALAKTKKKNIYEVTRPVEFKLGEEIGVDPESVNKASLMILSAVEEEKVIVPPLGTKQKNNSPSKEVIEIANANDIDLESVTGSGKNGEITIKDLEDILENRKNSQ